MIIFSARPVIRSGTERRHSPQTQEIRRTKSYRSQRTRRPVGPASSTAVSRGKRGACSALDSERDRRFSSQAGTGAVLPISQIIRVVIADATNAKAKELINGIPRSTVFIYKLTCTLFATPFPCSSKYLMRFSFHRFAVIICARGVSLT